MTAVYDIVFRNGTVVNQDGVHRIDVAVSSGRIAALGSIRAASAGESVDCTGLTLLPGVVDSQVHFREPGLTHKACIASEARAAVAGGVTSFMEMPNTNPLTISEETFTAKIKAAHHRMHCDFAFFIGEKRYFNKLCAKRFNLFFHGRPHIRGLNHRT